MYHRCLGHTLHSSRRHRVFVMVGGDVGAVGHDNGQVILGIVGAIPPMPTDEGVHCGGVFCKCMVKVVVKGKACNHDAGDAEGGGGGVDAEGCEGGGMANGDRFVGYKPIHRNTVMVGTRGCDQMVVYDNTPHATHTLGG